MRGNHRSSFDLPTRPDTMVVVPSRFRPQLMNLLLRELLNGFKLNPARPSRILGVMLFRPENSSAFCVASYFEREASSSRSDRINSEAT